MPPLYVSRKKGLQGTSPTFFFGQLRSSLSVISGLSSFFSTYKSSIRQFHYSGFSACISRETVDRRRALSAFGDFCRIVCISPSPAVSCQFYHHHSKNLLLESNQITFWTPSRKSSMESCTSPRFGLRYLNFQNWDRGQHLKFISSLNITCKTRIVHCCMRVTGSLKDQHPYGNNMLYKFFWSNTAGMSSQSNPSVDSGVEDLDSSVSPHSTGTSSDASLDGFVMEEQIENTEISSNKKMPGDRKLKLLSGSCCLPHPDKEKTGGEDSHFICVDEQAIGVADGVGGWADLGVDAGQYARELMSHSVAAIKEEPKGSIDPSRVLEKAYLSTKARGSSTACIIALTDQGINAVNLGDSGFIVVREGSTVFRSPVQQHDFNFTYQLEYGQDSDLPSSAQVFTFSVAPGDVVIAGTDGLFDNLYNNEISAIVVHAIRAGMGPQVTAQKIAALARQRAMDNNRQTPFSTAAQDAGYRYYGGKLDDITVVVSYITTSDA